MKILMVTPWYPDDRNPNSGVFIRTQAQALTQAGHKVIVISSKINYSSFGFLSCAIQHTSAGGVQEYRMAIRKSFPLYNQLNMILVSLLHSRKIARAFRPDVVHASIGYPGSFWGWALGKMLGVPFVVTEHTRIVNNFRSKLHRQLTLFGLKRAKAIIAVSRSLAKEIESYVEKDVVVIPNTIDVSRFKELPSSASPVPQIGFLGGMNTPVKGLDILLHALAKTPAECMLHIGGSGVLLQQYKQLAITLNITDKCRFYGFIPYDDVPSFISRMNFLVCSSRYETFCVSLIETMACGKPVVATRCGGPEEFVTPENGILVDKENPEKLAGALTWMTEHYGEYDSEAIKRYVNERFSEPAFVEKITTVYRQVMGREMRNEK